MPEAGRQARSPGDLLRRTLREWVVKTGDAGIYVGVMLVDG